MQLFSTLKKERNPIKIPEETIIIFSFEVDIEDGLPFFEVSV